MIRFIIVALVFGGALIFILQELYKFFGGISGTQSAVQGDFIELDGLIDSFNLTPWDAEEVDLISRNHVVKTQKSMYAYIEYGFFKSIYEEPIMAFATKEYNNNNRHLAVVKVNGKKFRFNQYNGKIDMLTQDGRKIGKVSINDGLHIRYKGRQLHIESYADAGLIPLSIDNKHILAIATDDDTTGTAGRMLRKINDYKKEESELILLSIAFALADKQI